MEEAKVASFEGTSDVRLGYPLAEMYPHFEGRLRLQRDGFRRRCRRRYGFHRHSPWNVRLITSICCSRVSRTKFTAYPETRMVRLGYFSGCSIASISISRLSTFTFM